MKRVGVAELKNSLSRYLRGVELGEVVEVMDRARPIARLVPVEAEPGGIVIRPAARPFASIRDRTYEPLAVGIDAADLLGEERAEDDWAGTTA
jgi:prevent-host-death family protein